MTSSTMTCLLYRKLNILKFQVNWYNAFRQCQMRDLRLATIGGYEEDMAVLEFIKLKSNYFELSLLLHKTNFVYGM